MVRIGPGIRIGQGIRSLVLLFLLAGVWSTHSSVTHAASLPTRSAGWTITVYYLAVEDFYAGPQEAVTGCLTADCLEHGDLGTYESSFLAAVRWQGAGKITRGPQAGRYLNWDPQNGYYLDTMFRDASGQQAVPWQTAAHATLPFGATFRITDCGTDDSGSAIDPAVCALFQAAQFTITDRFGTDNPDGGPTSLDLYMGEQTDVNMESNPNYVLLRNTTVELEPNPAVAASQPRLQPVGSPNMPRLGLRQRSSAAR